MTNSYHFRISLRVRHPTADLQQVTELLQVQPSRIWMAGEPRQTPKGEFLEGVNRESYWTAIMTSGRWPSDEIESSINDILLKLSDYKSFFHEIRSGGGKAELFAGWFFEGQSGGTLSYQTLYLAGDLKIDISLDVYPPSQPQSEYETSM